LNTPESHNRSERRNENKDTSIGVCPECKVRYGDCTEKPLYKCPHCGKYFCERHLPPKLVATRGYIDSIDDPVLKEKIYQEWRKEEGHPDPIWTEKYLEELKLEKEMGAEICKKKIYGEPKESKKEKIIPAEQRAINKVTKYLGVITRIEDYSDYCFKFTKYFLITLTCLVLLHFLFIGRFNLLSIILRSFGIVLLGYVLFSFYERTRSLIPYKWLCIACMVILVTYIHSTKDYTILEISDKVVGIPGFSNVIISKTYFLSSNASALNETYNKIVKPSYVSTCLRNVKDYIERERLRSTVDFSYKIIKVKDFSSREEAENFAKNYVSSIANYKICKKKRVEKGFLEYEYIPIDPPKKVVAIIFEIRFNSADFICIFDFCGRVEKVTDVLYCDENGTILQKADLEGSC